MSPRFIVRHPSEPSHNSYTSEPKAIAAAEELVKNCGGFAWIYQAIAFVEAVAAVTR